MELPQLPLGSGFTRVRRGGCRLPGSGGEGTKSAAYAAVYCYLHVPPVLQLQHPGPVLPRSCIITPSSLISASGTGPTRAAARRRTMYACSCASPPCMRCPKPATDFRPHGRCASCVCLRCTPDPATAGRAGAHPARAPARPLPASSMPAAASSMPPPASLMPPPASSMPAACCWPGTMGTGRLLIRLKSSKCI